MSGKRILIGSLQHETNTFSPVQTEMKDFELMSGPRIFKKLSVQDVFERAGMELIPTIYANALPSGKTALQTFETLKNKILTGIAQNKPIDGVWLYLHGAMEVEKIGSGEAALVRDIRNLIGPDIPIAVALDFHANNTEQLIESANIICGYRTAPHVDQVETQIRAAELLIKCVKEKILPKPVMIQPPLIMTGDMVTTTIDPMKSLIGELSDLEIDDEILSASIFNGQPWVDAPNTTASVIVIAKSDINVAREKASALAKKFWDARYDFHFEEEAMEPVQVIKEALKSDVRPVFITDSGDNTTAGASGDNTFLLKLFLKEGQTAKKILVAGITDSRALHRCDDYGLGSDITLKIGAEYDQTSENVMINGIIKNKGRLLGWSREDAGATVVIGSDNIDIIVTEKRGALISKEHFEKAGVRIADYDIIVVKMGYLFSALKAIAKRSILALTPGASCEDIAKIKFSKIKHPIYPIEKDFDWDPF